MNRVFQIVLVTSLVLLCWLGAQAIHESGHMLHAIISGGRVAALDLYPLHFSRTSIAPNPHPQFVVWGGPIWGCAWPSLLYGLARALRWKWTYLLRFFAGFCLILNGAYLASGIVLPAGDTEDLLRLGVPAWVLLIGLPAVAAGLWLWHKQGPYFGLGSAHGGVDRRAAITVAVLMIAVATVEIFVFRQ